MLTSPQSQPPDHLGGRLAGASLCPSLDPEVPGVCLDWEQKGLWLFVLGLSEDKMEWGSNKAGHPCYM